MIKEAKYLENIDADDLRTVHAEPNEGNLYARFLK